MARNSKMDNSTVLKTVAALLKAERNDQEDAFDALWAKLEDAFGDKTSEVAYAAELQLIGR